MEKIASDLKEAMKQKDALKISTLRMINAEIKNLEIEKRAFATDEDVLKILSSSAKKHQDSIAQFEAGNRADLASQEKAELAIIQTYLPVPLSEAELQILIDQAVSEAGAASSADFGKVMKILMPKIQGRSSGQIVSQKLKSKLETNNPPAGGQANN